MKKLSVFICLTAFFFCMNPVFSQDQSLNKEQLEKLEREIRDLEKKVKKETEQETDLLNYLNKLKKDIYYSRSLIKKYDKSITQLGREIKAAEKEIEEYQKDLHFLRESSKNRIITMYKKGREPMLKAVFSNKSLSQTSAVMKYFLILSKADYKKINDIKDKKTQLEIKQDEIKNSLNKYKNRKNAKNREKARLERTRKLKNTTLGKIRNEKKYNERLLDEKRRAQEQLLRVVADASSGSNLIDPLIYNTPFSSLKGRLAWPIEGQILTKYQPSSRSLGIEIKAPYGARIKAIARGRVSRIDWNRHYGNMIVISHGEGYITSYAYLSDILVEKNQEVYPNDFIARVGRDEIDDKSKLGFWIWKGIGGGRNPDTLNPESWLER